MSAVKKEDSLLSEDLRRQGIMFALNEQIETALQVFDEAIRANPLNASAYGGRGMVRYGLGDIDGAFEDASKAIELDPLNGDWYGNRAFIRILLGNYEEALNDLNKSLELNPRYGWAYYRRGNVKLLMTDTAAACDDWKMAARMGEQEALDSTLVHCPDFVPEEPPVILVRPAEEK